MRILIVNDDGIASAGIRKLARLATEFGETWVCAPHRQCSGMSQRITVGQDIRAERYDFPVPGVYRAYVCSGTPADCTDVAVRFLMDSQPDVIFSGINRGYNAGYDIAYSGTVGAAMEGLMLGIPAIAFSHEAVDQFTEADGEDEFEVTDHYIKEITEKLLSSKLPHDRIWNVNFPECTLKNCCGIKWDTRPAGKGFFETSFLEAGGIPERADGRVQESQGKELYVLQNADIRTDPALYPEGTDLNALAGCYISVGTVICNTM